MGVEPPFLYDPPSRYSNPNPNGNFNPKAVTQASYAPKPEKPKQEGPLVNFNMHPDSYLVLPYGNTNAKQMSRRTKTKVKWGRIFQLVLRIFEFAGAVGLLVMCICIRSVESTTAWILRITPGIAMLHNIYAIYHLSRRASGRTPTSSASYMLFSAGLDASLASFYAFSVLTSRTQYSLFEKSPDQMAWTSVFPGTTDTAKLVEAICLTSIVAGSLHCFSLFMSIFLAIIFRKISKLPPDMNPLEDNLTSRHKKKNSTVSDPFDSKRSSRTTIASTTDDSLDSPPRKVPFMHTRTNSNDTLVNSPTRPNSNRNSRADLPSQQSYTALQDSRLDLTRSSATKRGSYAESVASKRMTRTNLLRDTWYVNSENMQPAAYTAVAQQDDADIADAPLTPYRDLAHREAALSSHPPKSFSHGTPPKTRGLTPGSANRNGTPKGKSYGDLKPRIPPVMGTYVDLPRERADARVVSRSGNDYDIIGGKESGRDVSGKVAEEGRGGGSWARFRKVSGL